MSKCGRSNFEFEKVSEGLDIGCWSCACCCCFWCRACDVLAPACAAVERMRRGFSGALRAQSGDLSLSPTAAALLHASSSRSRLAFLSCTAPPLPAAGASASPLPRCCWHPLQAVLTLSYRSATPPLCQSPAAETHLAHCVVRARFPFFLCHLSVRLRLTARVLDSNVSDCD